MTKSRRIQLLLDTFTRHGSLDKSQIDQLMSSSTGLTKDELSHSLYRDLIDLVADHRLERQDFHSDGHEMDADELQNAKNKKSKWSIPGFKNSVVGKKLITDLGGDIFVSVRLTTYVTVLNSFHKSTDSIQLLVTIGSQTIQLRIDFASLPATVIMTRKSETLTPHLFSALETKFGKRLICMALPDSFLSATKNEVKPGHIMIEFKSLTNSTITDFGSKNRPMISNFLSRQIVESFIKNNFSSTTSTMSLSEAKSNIKNIKFTEVINPIDIALPFIIALSDTRCLVVN